MSSSITVTDNIIENNDGNGIWTQSGASATITNNKILNNDFYGVSLFGSDRSVITSNIIKDNSPADLRVNTTSNVSFNVYSSSSGSVNGNYNVDYQGNAH